MFENCTENGQLFSCFENFGLIKNSNQCGSTCESKNLNQLGINDFYNFHDRLQQSNFFLKERDDNSYVLYRTFQLKKPSWEVASRVTVNETSVTINQKRKPKRRMICTSIKFSFQSRLWTDHTASVGKKFIEKWQTKKGFRNQAFQSENF